MDNVQKNVSLKSAVMATDLLNTPDTEPTMAVLALTDNYVSYHDADGLFIELSPGTAILVDETRGIALFGNDHFEIWPIEYRIVEV